MNVDTHRILKINPAVQSVNEVVGEVEVTVDLPINFLRIKVFRVGKNAYLGKTNYAIKNPIQFEPYQPSHNPSKTIQKAIEEAVEGFMSFYDPKMKDETKFVIVENF
jgi:hypothetical protein